MDNSVIKTTDDRKLKKYLLDDLVTMKLTTTTLTGNYADIPQFLSSTVLILVAILIPINVYLVNPAYITSHTGYPNGGHVYTHIQEAIHVKELIRNMTFNFWNNDFALGYPMFMGTAPLSTFLFSFIYLFFERFASPISLTRWTIIFLISMIPISFYKGSRIVMFSRTQSLFVALLSLSINSEMQFGLELNAFLVQGLIGQLLGTIFLPITAAKIYTSGMKMGWKRKHNNFHIVLLLCLTYLSHCLIGIYCSILSFITALCFTMKKEFSKPYMQQAFFTTLKLHSLVILYLSWWLIPCMISYPYMVGRFRCTAIETMRSSFISSLINGDIFDYKHFCLWVTGGILVSLVIFSYSLYRNVKVSMLHWNHMSVFKVWLLMVTIVSVTLLLLNQYVIQFILLFFPLQVHASNSLLFGVHYTGIILSSFTLVFLTGLIDHLKLKQKLQKYLYVLFVLIVSLVMIKSAVNNVSNQVTLVEISDQFNEELLKIKNEFDDGRILVHHRLGTGGDWDISNIPLLTGKPGVFSQTEGYPGGLSMFYLNEMTNEKITPSKFLSLLRLYNIHYLAISSNFVDNQLISLHQVKHITTVDDLQIFQIDSDDEPYGYFEFVRIPGYIDGDLYHVNLPVLESLDVYPEEVLLFINPRRGNPIRKNPLVDIQVYEFANGLLPFSLLTTWKFNEKEVASEQALHEVRQIYANSWSNSQVVEERRIGDEYHVIVNVEQREKFSFMEHLLLKVTYHPFWRCFYFTVNRTYTLGDVGLYSSADQISATVNHVTPNMISVTLPPGRYHVIFRYRFPGILKILFVICTVMIMQRLCNLSIINSIYVNAAKTSDRLWNFAMKVVIMFTRLIVKTYYSYCGLTVPDKLSMLISYFTVPVLSVRNKVCNDFSLRSVSQSFLDLATGKYAVAKHVTSLFRMYNQCPKVLPVNYHPEIKVIKRSKEKGAAIDDISIMNNQTENNYKSSLSPLLNKSFDLDSSLSCDELYRSPPTPPKHCKKSLRKKQSRTFKCGGEHKRQTNNDFKFERRTSPVLDNIMTSLKRNSLSPDKSQPIQRSSSPARTPPLLISQTLDNHPISLKNSLLKDECILKTGQSSVLFQFRQQSPPSLLSTDCTDHPQSAFTDSANHPPSSCESFNMSFQNEEMEINGFNDSLDKSSSFSDHDMDDSYHSRFSSNLSSSLEYYSDNLSSINPSRILSSPGDDTSYEGDGSEGTINTYGEEK